MLKRLLSALLTVVAVVGLAHEAGAQYMYLDANANGVPDPNDRLNENGTPTTVDLYVRTNMNRNGTTAVCNTGPEPLTIGQYQINLVAVGGIVTYSGYMNRQASMPTSFGEFNPDGVRYKNGNGGGTQLAPGTYQLCTLTITGVSGTPRIDIVDLVPGSQDFTGFGTSCWGNAYDNIYRLDGPNVRPVWGAPGDFTDWDGLGGAGGVNPPTVMNPGSRTVDELTTLAFTVVATDPDPDQTLTFSLTFGTPPATGATINASTGAFSWTPTEAQGPGVYPVTVTATDNGAPPASVSVGFTIQVNEVIPPPAGPSLLVTSQLDHTVKEYDGITGVFIRNAATGAGQPSGLGDPLDAIIGVDGNMLVTDGQQDAIKRFDRATGHFLGIFAGAVSPYGMTIFGGKVYVCQGNPPHIVRSFDAATGADAGSFIPTGGANPFPTDVEIANGRLYVCYWNLGTVEMFDLTTRESLGLLFPPGTIGLSSIAFGPDGNLYASHVRFVDRYHPTTGEFLGRFVDTGDQTGQRYAIGIDWGPDGNLYVATQNTAGVQRYNGSTGAFMDDFVPPGSGGLTAPYHITFTVPAARPPAADAGGPYVGVAGVPLQFDGTESADPDGDALAYAWSFGDGVTGVGATPMHSYATVGDYNVTLRVTDPGGLYDEDVTTATVRFEIPVVVILKNNGAVLDARKATKKTKIAVEQSGFQYTNILVNTLRLTTDYPNSGSVTECAAEPKGGTGTIGDVNLNGTPDYLISFLGSCVRNLFNNTPDNSTVNVIVTGEFATSSGTVLLRGLKEATVRTSGGGTAPIFASAYPNPFNPETAITYTVKSAGPVTLRIFSIDGRLVRTLKRDEETAAGTQDVTWNGTDDSGHPVSSGIYFVKTSQKSGGAEASTIFKLAMTK